MKMLLMTFFLTIISVITIKAQLPADAKQILEDANTKMSGASNIAYDFSYNGTGKFAGHFSGSVKILRKGGPNNSRIHVKLRFHESDAPQGKVNDTWFIDVNQGRIRLLDVNENRLKIGSMQGGSAHLTTYAYYAVLFQYVQQIPFGTELKNKSLQYVGKKDINGIECDVVKVLNQFGDWVHWYIGIDDQLIHAQKSENTAEETKGKFFFETKQLKINASLTDASFEIPQNDKTTIFEEDKKVIAVGAKAPQWQIRDANGMSITGAGLKGKAVLLDFWASWCRPCWNVMPVVNKIGGKYKDLVVMGVNVWENPELDPAAYMKKKNLDYKIVVDDDASLTENFKIGFLPVLILINKEGVISYISTGYSDKFEAELDQAVKDAL